MRAQPLILLMPLVGCSGEPSDTTNTTDNIIGGVDDISPYLLEVERMADGAMLASKVIAIRASTADPSCSAGGMGGGMGSGPGGMP